MEYLFSELIDEGLMPHNLTSSTADSSILASIKLRINEIQSRICYYKAWEWRKRTFYLTTRAPYTTGTITVTENSKTVTGSGTTWTNAMKLGYVLIGGKSYRINRIASTTSIILESAYPDATASGQTYKIIFPDYYLDPEISSIINVKVASRDINVSSLDKLTTSIGNPAVPDSCAISERSKYDHDNTGTVTVTNASATVTGSGTDFTAEVEGMAFKADEFGKKYKIKSRDGATQLTLWNNYEGETGSGKSFKINPAGTPIITFRNAPDDYYWVEIEALISLPRLVSNNDVSLIPNHEALIEGTRWLSHDLKNENPVRIEQLAAEFRRALKDLDNSYKAVSNVKWISQDELRYRRNSIGKHDPLSD